MKSFKLILIFLSLLSCFSLQSQTVKITGSGNGYSKAELKFFVQTDPVTKNQKPLFNVQCDENGSFTCQVSCKSATVISIKTGIYRIFLHIREGEALSIKLPDFIARSAEDEQNPFFIESRIIPEVVNVPDNINNLMRTYDLEYDPVFNEVAERISKKYKREEIPSLIENLNKVSSSMSQEFNDSYISFRLIMLNMVANGTYPGRVEDSVIINKTFLPDNQAYIDLIEQIFTGYFRNIAAGKLKESYIKAISNSSLDELRIVILKDGKGVNNQLVDYIIILNLTNEFYSGAIPTENVLNLLKSLKDNGASPFIKDLASSIAELLISGQPGSIPPGFTLAGNDGKLHSVNDFMGKFVLISFARTDSRLAILEFGIMKSWQNSYSKNLQIITILTDKDFTSAAGRLKNYGFGWLFLNGSDADLLEYQYNIKMYPSFILLDREGKIIYSPAPYPSENLESVISNKIGNL